MFSSIVRSSSIRSTASTAFRRVPRAFFSDGSHSDFAPQRKTVEGEDEALKIIKVCSSKMLCNIFFILFHIWLRLAFRNMWKATQSCYTWRAIHRCRCAVSPPVSSKHFKMKVSISAVSMSWTTPTSERESRSLRKSVTLFVRANPFKSTQYISHSQTQWLAHHSTIVCKWGIYRRLWHYYSNAWKWRTSWPLQGSQGRKVDHKNSI